MFLLFALTGCMHVLRSSFLPLYLRQVVTPYTSDPYPSVSLPALSRALAVTCSGGAQSGATSDSAAALTQSSQQRIASSTQAPEQTSIIPVQRETLILDMFIMVQVRADMRSDESDLYLDNDDERYRDMFNFMQVCLLHFGRHTLEIYIICVFHRMVLATCSHRGSGMQVWPPL
jgi:hypothetical protein